VEKRTDKKNGKKRIWVRVLKWFFGIIGGLVALVLLAVTTLWFFPELLLNSKRASGFVEGILVPEKPLPPGTYPLTLDIDKPDWKTRAFRISLVPGCWDIKTASINADACFEDARIEVAIRLHLKIIAQLVWIGPIHLHSSRLVLRFPKSKEPPPPEDPGKPFDPADYMKYVAKDFRWREIDLRFADVRLPESGIRANLNLRNEAATGKLDSIELGGSATGVSEDGSRWKAALEGTARHEAERIILPLVRASYQFGKSAPNSKITAELGATYQLKDKSFAGSLKANWIAPTPQVKSLAIDKGDFLISTEEIATKATVKAVLAGISRAGTPPMMALRVAASRKQKTSDRVDFNVAIDEYRFMGLDLVCDAEFAMYNDPKVDRIQWKKGKLRIGTDNFRKTVFALRRTPWAVPAPFAVLDGSIWAETEALENREGFLHIPIKFRTDLKSREQAVATETGIHFRLDSRTLKPKDLAINAQLAKVRLRLPDYDPLAPVPVITRDPRIVTKAELTEEQKVRAKQLANGDDQGTGEVFEPPAMPTRITIQSPPGAIQLLNRFFTPEMPGQVDLAIDTSSQFAALKGIVQTSAPFTFNYLNRSISVDRIAIRFQPAIEIEARISMKRGGYKVMANFTQAAGRSKIELTSAPLLSEDEIVSLILYGVPRTSVTADQDQSVGSAQAAMSSQALGIFSLIAFASTPIETVLYDPATKTYSAVVRLPGGVVASIGNSWEDERQVALSKSIGRNWAISTELIQDANGTNRGGTMLRWRKRY
jgi:hypothetical protein